MDVEWKLRKRASVIRAIVTLGLHPEPIRSIQQAKRLHNVGPAVFGHLQRIVNGPDTDSDLNSDQFSSAAAAILVCLFEHAQKCETSKTPLCPLEELRAAVARRLPSEQVILSSDMILADIRCGCFDQLRPMEKGSWSSDGKELLKTRSRHKCRVFEILPAGANIAKRIIQRKHKIGPGKALGPLISNAFGISETLPHVVLLVDSREGGGEDHHLQTITDSLKRRRTSFETRQLPSGLGDYLWIVRHRKVEFLVPILIERKTPVSLHHFCSFIMRIRSVRLTSPVVWSTDVKLARALQCWRRLTI